MVNLLSFIVSEQLVGKNSEHSSSVIRALSRYLKRVEIIKQSKAKTITKEHCKSR